MRTFIKHMDAPRAAAELAGWHAVRHLLTVPQLYGHRSHDEHIAVRYEDVFATRRCSRLLGDCISRADHQMSSEQPIRDLIHGVGHDLERSLRHTGRRLPLSECVPALYLARLAPNGRLDQWYPSSRRLDLDAAHPTITELATYRLVINKSAYRLDIRQYVKDLRHQLHPDIPVATAITQGDPTEPNIAYPRTWLDFEHAGRNSIPGELANLLWYLMALGGWLVPRYQPDVYRRTLRQPLQPAATPEVDLSAIPTDRHIEITYHWHVGPGRAAALQAFRDLLHGPLAEACGTDEHTVFASLRPYLALRILGVLDIAHFQAPDQALCIAKLAELRDPNTTLDTFTDITATSGRPTAAMTGGSTPTTTLQERP